MWEATNGYYWGVGARLQVHLWEATNGYYWGVGARLQVHLWEATNGYYWGVGRGTSGRQSVNAIGGWGGATGVLVGGDTWVLWGGG